MNFIKKFDNLIFKYNLSFFRIKKIHPNIHLKYDKSKTILFVLLSLNNLYCFCIKATASEMYDWPNFFLFRIYQYVHQKCDY